MSSLDVLTAAVAAHLHVAPGDIHPQVDLVADLSFDSLDLLEIAEMVESELGMELPSEAWDGGTTLAEVAATLETALTGGGASR